MRRRSWNIRIGFWKSINRESWWFRLECEFSRKRFCSSANRWRFNCGQWSVRKWWFWKDSFAFFWKRNVESILQFNDLLFLLIFRTLFRWRRMISRTIDTFYGSVQSTWSFLWMRNAASVADKDCTATLRMMMTKLSTFSTSEWTRYVLLHSHAKISEINCRRKLETIEMYVCICVNCFRVMNKRDTFTVNDILRVHVSNDFLLRHVLEVRSFSNSFCEIHRFLGIDVNWDISQKFHFL